MTARGEATRKALVQATLDTLREDGFAKTSARTVAARAAVQQGMVFYHFGTMGALLLASLDEVSRRRAQRYGPLVAGVGNLTQLVQLGELIVREDLEAGYAAIALELLAGTRADAALSAQVAARLEAWHDFATQALDAGLGRSVDALPVGRDEMGRLLVAQYLGMELLALVDGAGAAHIGELFGELQRSAPFLERFGLPLLRHIRR